MNIPDRSKTPKPTETGESSAFVRFLYRHAWVFATGLAIATMLLQTMSARAHHTGTPPLASAPATRTALEMQWNTREDHKAGSNLGQPGTR